MAGALRRDPQTDAAGGPDHGGDVVGVAGQGDRGGPLVDGDVPRHPRLVVPGVAGEVDGAVAQSPQSGDPRGGVG